MNAEPLTLWVGALIRRLGNKCRLRTQAHLQSKWQDGKQSNNEKKTKKTNPHKYTETIYYIRLCIYRSTDPLRYCWVVIKKIIWSMQTGKWGGRHWVVCCCCLHTADLYLYMYEWVCVCVGQSQKPYSWWPLGLRKHPDILCASSNMYIFMCNIPLDPWCCVQNYQLFLWRSGLITSHSRLCLVVFWMRFPIAPLPHCSTFQI